VPPDNDPYHVFETLFAKAPGAGGDLQLARAINTRRSILDYVSQDLARFSRTLGTEDRQRVDGHLQSVREIEQQLTPRPVPGGCTVPTLGDPIDVKITENFDKVTRLQMDIAVAALAADFTRVVVLELSDSASAHIIPYWLGLAKSRDAGTGTGDVNSHHTIAHANGATKRRLDGWFHETFAYLIGKLKGEKEAGKTILDSAAVLFANNMGNGAAHNVTNVPWFMAGSCGGAFKTGRSLKTGNVPQTRVLNEIISAMGAPTAGFADTPYQGELPDLRG
jgi:hypothetical protein